MVRGGNAREALRRVAGALSSPPGGAARGSATARASGRGPPVALGLVKNKNNPGGSLLAPGHHAATWFPGPRSHWTARGSIHAGSFALSPILRDDDERDAAMSTSRARTLHTSARRHLAAKLPTSAKQSAKAAANANANAVSTTTTDPADSHDKGFKRSAVDIANDKRALHAVNVAMYSNTAIFCCKMGAYCVTGSSAMLAEAVHSVADIVNQGLLRVGINSSAKAPDAKYNYGYRRERFVWSLISAVGVFFMVRVYFHLRTGNCTDVFYSQGSGVSVMHGVHNIMHPTDLQHIYVGIGVLGASAAIDSYSLYVAYEALKANAAAKGMALDEFVKVSLFYFNFHMGN